MEVETQSAVLDETEVTEALSTEEAPAQEEVTLPSDEVAFDMPEKFKGKSAEEIAKSYLELEKLKGKQEEEVVQESTEGEEPSEEPTKAIEVEQYNKYAESFDANGGLSEAEYQELADAGYSREVVDAEIAARNDRQEFDKYKQEKTLNAILEPLGGGQEKFKEVAQWANQTKTPEDVKAFNDALAMSSKVAQQAMLRGLYAEYASAGSQTDTVLHTNTPQTISTKGYATESDFMKDLNNPAYKTDKSYVKAVEAKLARSNTNHWSF